MTAADVIRAQLPGITDAAAGRARAVSAELAKRSGREPQGLFFSMAHSGVRQPEKRVFITGAPTGGGALIQTDVSPTMIDRLRERTIVRKLGATVIANLQGGLSIPRLTQSATAYWVAENQAVTVSDPHTDSVPLSLKTCGGLVELSRNMVMQTSPDAQTMIENDLALILAVALDKAAIVGGGTNEPHGLLASGSGITLIPITAAPTWPELIAVIGAVDQSNALAGSLGWAANAATVKSLRSTIKTFGDTSSTMLMPNPKIGGL